jgi:hypothetical protein
MKARTIALACALVMIGTPVLAQVRVDDTPGQNLGGYDGIASGAAVSFQPFLPALVSTGDVPFEGTIALSSSRVKSGGNAFGRGALSWPGSTAADLGPVLGVAFGQPELGGLIPKWPLQASATQNDGEVITGLPPVAAMRAYGAVDRADGDTRIADIHVPRVLQIEHISSTSTSIVTDGGVNATSIVKLQGVSLLAGYIKVEEIRSISRTSSIGSAASSSGDVDVVGMTIGGIDVSVTDDGFQIGGLPPDAASAPGAGDEPFPNPGAEEAVNQILSVLGAKITLFKSISSVVGGKAERMQPGMIVSVNNPVGGTGPIPPGRFDIFLAATSASSLSTLPFSAGGDIGGGDGDGLLGGGSASSGDDRSPSISLGGGTDVSGGSVTKLGDDLGDAAEGSLGAIGSLDDTARRSDYRFGGLPLGLVLGLLLLALLLARYVRNGFRGLLASGAEQVTGGARRATPSVN